MSYWDKFSGLSCSLVELTSFRLCIHLPYLWILLKRGIFVDFKICSNFIFTLILSSFLSLDLNRNYIWYFWLTHHLILNFYYFVYCFMLFYYYYYYYCCCYYYYYYYIYIYILFFLISHFSLHLLPPPISHYHTTTLPPTILPSLFFLFDFSILSFLFPFFFSPPLLHLW